MNQLVPLTRSLFKEILSAIQAFFNQRHSDTGLIISSVLIGFAVGLFITIFHLIMVSFEHFFESIIDSTGQFPILRFFAFPLIAGFGGLIVGVLNTTIFRHLEGEGLPLVATSIHHKRGIIDWFHTIKSIINAAFSISTGGGAGREAPTVLLGAALGSGLGQVLQLRTNQLKLLVGAGSAAAIGGIFNAPLGGIVFALEVIVGRLTFQSFLPLVISSVMATATSRLFLGNNQLLVEPPKMPINLHDYFWLALAGILSGWVAVYFLRTYRLTRILVYKRMHHIPDIWKPAIGGLIVGSMVALLPTLLETTYDPINQAIAGNGVVWVAILTLLLKPMSNAITLASKGEGGTFAPAMKVGAMFGFCLGSLLELFIPSVSPGLFALVCAGAVIAGTFYAPLTGTIVLFEISRNYEMILPLMFASIFATFIVNRMKIHTFNPIQHKMNVRMK